GFLVRTGGAQRLVCPIQIEKLRLEVSSHPYKETLMFFVLRISNGLQEFRVRERASTIFRRRVSRPRYAHRVLNVRVGHQDGFQQEIVVPVVAEIVMIVKASAD